MKPIWRQKWRNLARKRAKSGLIARSSTLTLRGEAILPSFGFGRFGHLLRRERLENEPHFLRFRFKINGHPIEYDWMSKVDRLSSV